MFNATTTITRAQAAHAHTTTFEGGIPSWVDRAAYPFTPRALRLAEGMVSYIDEGEGDPILFVHGTPSWSFEYRHLIRALSATHRCIAMDHLGFGLSERPARFEYTPEGHARVLVEFVDRMDLDRFTLVVHDFGGPIALPLALAEPSRVGRLVILNSWMWSFAGDRDMRRKARVAGSAIGRFLYRYMNFSLRVLMPAAFGDRKKLTPEIHRQYLDPFRSADGRDRVLWTLARALLGSSAHFDSLWRHRARLANIPTLILWGLSDGALPPSLLSRWREGLPHARVVELSRAGHWPHEEATANVIAELGAFLRTTTAGEEKGAPS